jgi:hypothetical protein
MKYNWQNIHTKVSYHFNIGKCYFGIYIAHYATYGLALIL